MQPIIGKAFETEIARYRQPERESIEDGTDIMCRKRRERERHTAQRRPKISKSQKLSMGFIHPNTCAQVRF